MRNSLDIVAVHGITENAYDTWIHGNRTFWLQDLIPKDFLDVRVFSYRYPVNVFYTFAIGTIGTYIRSLLESLKGERRSKDVCPLFIYYRTFYHKMLCDERVFYSSFTIFLFLYLLYIQASNIDIATKAADHIHMS